MSTENDDELFKAEIAKALGAIGRSLEVMQANLFITRAMVDLLSEHNILPVVDVRHHALRLVHEASVSSGTIDALHQLLGESGPKLSSILQ